MLWLLLACRTTIPSKEQDTGIERDAALGILTVHAFAKPNIWFGDEASFESLITFSPADAETTAAPPSPTDFEFKWECSNGVIGTEPELTFTPLEVDTISCTLTVSNDSLNLESTAMATTTIHTAPENADWTVLIYLAGDNNLEEAAIIDINEMERIGSSDEINVIVEFDRSPRFYSGHEDWSGAKRFYIVKDDENQEAYEHSDIVSVELETLGIVDTGSPNTIADFAKWGMENFPSDKVALILWNHGWSWSLQSDTQKGILTDDSSGNDISIAEGEFETLLSSIITERGSRLDLLGLDACTMQSWEVATVAEPYVDTLVASQDYVNWDGWVYDQLLADLVSTPEMSALELAESINYSFWRSGDSTISTINLEYLSDFNTKLNALSEELLNRPTPSIIPISPQTYSPDGSQSGPDHDLFGLLENLNDAVEDTATRLIIEDMMTMKSSLIPHNYVGEWIEGANGLSIYAPPTGGELDQAYLSTTWSEVTLWDDLLLNDIELLNQPNNTASN